MGLFCKLDGHRRSLVHLVPDGPAYLTICERCGDHIRKTPGSTWVSIDAASAIAARRTAGRAVQIAGRA